MIADTMPHTASLRTVRLLAKRLLHGSRSPGDARIVDALRLYLQLLQAGDEQANEASRELTCWHQSPHSAPYFLEMLQAQAHRDERKKSGAYYTPWPVAQWIVQRIEQFVPSGPLRIVDPACGGGVFLLAAVDLAARRPGSALLGYDTSAAAIAATTELLRGEGASSAVRQINPLLAGEQLQDDLLSASGPLVILGNPPYANFGRRNRGPWIDNLVADYREGVEEQKLNLTDDFIKFLRWGQHWIEEAGCGVLAMITSRTYLSGLTHRGMRRSLAQSFPHIELVDLHGDGEPGDANIFGIRRGVAIAVFSKLPGRDSGCVQYQSVTGSRTKKLKWLRQPASRRSRFRARAPDWMFVPGQRRAKQTRNDYLSWPRLDQIFSEFISGVQTKNDRLFVDFDRDVLASRMKQHLAQQGEPFESGCLRPYVVGPFDRRWIYYDPRLLGRARWSVMRHLVQVESNIALVFMRQSTATKTYDHALVVDTLASDRVFYSRRGAPFLAPLWRSESGERRVSSLAQEWVDEMARRLGASPDPQTLFAYIYAALHSPHYRQANLVHLQRDYPRIPWPSAAEQFVALASIGEQLIGSHLSAGDKHRPLECLGSLSKPIARGFPLLNDGLVQINRDCSFRLPNPGAADFHLGGHCVLRQWLKSRRGRTLSVEDLQTLVWLVDVGGKTRQLMQKIDEIATAGP